MNIISEYINKFVTADNLQLITISKQEETLDNIQPSVGLQVGKLLALLIRITGAKRVLEFGTCLGYSTVWMAEALKETGGRLISVEYDKDLYEKTKENLKCAGLSEIVDVVCGDASKVIKDIHGPFDIILQDSDKSLYPAMLDDCINLTRKNGLIIGDDALFMPMDIQRKFSEPIHKYLEKVFSDSRLYSTLLPIGDGVVISLKISD